MSLAVRKSCRPPVKRDRVVRDLRRLIASGKLAPGERMPTHKVLARRFDAESQTICDAMRVLGEDGFIETRHREAGGDYDRLLRMAKSQRLAGLAFAANPFALQFAKPPLVSLPGLPRVVSEASVDNCGFPSAYPDGQLAERLRRHDL